MLPRATFLKSQRIAHKYEKELGLQLVLKVKIDKETSPTSSRSPYPAKIRSHKAVREIVRLFVFADRQKKPDDDITTNRKSSFEFFVGNPSENSSHPCQTQI